jgi:hypothetical protein
MGARGILLLLRFFFLDGKECGYVDGKFFCGSVHFFLDFFFRKVYI